MEELNVDQQASCPFCFGPLERKIEGDVGQHIAWKVCGFCRAVFGPPWPERQWAEINSEPDVLYVLSPGVRTGSGGAR